jgi:hypothetical protein
MQEDAGFSAGMAAFLFALEVQYLVENSLVEAEFLQLPAAYGIPDERAHDILEATCARYVSQLLNLALRAAKKYDEREAVRWATQVLQYASYIPGAVAADGNLFKSADKARLIAFCQAQAEAQVVDALPVLIPAEGARTGSPGGPLELRAVLATKFDNSVTNMVAKLQGLISLRDDFVPPVQGMQGLLSTPSDKSAAAQGKKLWAWG